MNRKFLGLIVFMAVLIFIAYSPIVYKSFCAEYGLVGDERIAPFIALTFICVGGCLYGLYLMINEPHKP